MRKRLPALVHVWVQVAALAAFAGVGSASCKAQDRALRYYVYDLDRVFRERGQRDCSSYACAFGNSSRVEGVHVFDTDQYVLP